MIVHAAALKHVPVCEYNPFEAVQTNVHGAENIVSAAIENDVPLTVNLSTDKAVNPVNLYGATKLAAEKIINQGNAYAADSRAHFASVRYGNVVGSRGSVVPLFKRQAESGKITITDERMTRFWITLDQAVQFVVDSAGRMGGGETFIPRIPSMRVTDMAEALAPEAEIETIGIRPGEKLHELLVTDDESRHAYRVDNGFVIMPEYPSWPLKTPENATSLPGGFTYSSGDNDWWLGVDELRDDDGRREGGGLTATFLPYGRQEITEDDVRAVTSALREPMITQGPLVEEFEQAMAGHLGARHAVAFSSGTAALHGAAHAVGIGPGDEALVPPITFAASANCVLYQGGDVRFVDIARETWNLDTAAAAARGRRADQGRGGGVLHRPPGRPGAARGRARPGRGDRGRLPRAGRPPRRAAGRRSRRRRHHLLLAAPGEVHDHRRGRAGHDRGRRAGRTDAPVPHARHGARAVPGRHRHRRALVHGAAGAGVQLPHHRLPVRARHLPARAARRLGARAATRSPPATASCCRARTWSRRRRRLPTGSLHGHHLFVIRVVAGAEARLRVFEGLRAAGIGVQVHYIPIYRFPYYRDVVGAPQDACPNAEELYAGAISLPMFPAMEDSDVDRVVTELLNLAS